MRIRYGVSPWIHQFPASKRPEFPRARGASTADVVIIGGGLTGCLIAQACAADKLKVVLLEGGRIGQGGSGFSNGLILPEPGPSFRDVSGALGLRVARKVFEAWRRASLDGAAQLRRLGIKCGLTPQDLLVAASFADEKLLRKEFDARAEADQEPAWLEPKPIKRITSLDAAAALKLGDSFSFDPYAAAVALAQAAAKKKAQIFERSEVRKVRFTRKDAEVDTGDATFRTSKIVVTTGSMTTAYRQLRRHFSHRETYLTLTEPLPATMRKAIGAEDFVISQARVPPHQIHWAPEGRLLLAGGDQNETPAAKSEAVITQRTGQLMYEMLLMYPAISGLKPEYGWKMPYARPVDGLPYIGPHRNFPHHLFAVGGSGASLTGAFLGARILMRAIRNMTEKGDDLFGWLR